jgi:AcrR family transcriptional regulator
MQQKTDLTFRSQVDILNVHVESGSNGTILSASPLMLSRAPDVTPRAQMISYVKRHVIHRTGGARRCLSGITRSPGRRGKVSGEETKRDQILDAAARAFGRYGFRKTSIADIVREAGVARATVYNHFSTKEEIFSAVVKREVTDLIGKVHDAVARESSTPDRLRAAVLTHMDEIQKKVNVFRLTDESFQEILPMTREVTHELTEGALKTYRWILSEGVKSGEVAVDDIDTVAWTVLLAFKGVFMTTLSGQVEERTPGVADMLLEIIWNGLRPRGEAL